MPGTDVGFHLAAEALHRRPTAKSRTPPGALEVDVLPVDYMFIEAFDHLL